MKGPAARRGFDTGNSGLAGNMYILTDAILRCGDALHEDIKYAAEVHRLRRLAGPSIGRHQGEWNKRRDGYTDDQGRLVQGFWLNERGEPLEAGEQVPKETLIAMEGAIMEILHLDGVYWYKERKKTSMKDEFLARGPDEDDKADD